MFIELNDEAGPEDAPDVDGAGLVRQVYRLLEVEGGAETASAREGPARLVVPGLVVHAPIRGESDGWAWPGAPLHII